MNYEAVYRTAPATPGLLKKYYIVCKMPQKYYVIKHITFQSSDSFEDFFNFINWALFGYEANMILVLINHSRGL